MMDTFDTVPDDQLYDAELALTLAAGSVSVRNAVVSGVLDYFSDAGAMSGLLALDAYPERAEEVRELAHRAVGLARQAAMAQLEAHCRRIEANMESGAIPGAQALARELEPLLACIRNRVEGDGP